MINKLLKYLGYIFFFCVISLLLPSSMNYKYERLHLSPYGRFIAQYERITTDGEHSDLKPYLFEIVSERLKCYSKTSDYNQRLQKCRKEYMYKALRTAREQIKAAPSLGEFVTCVRDCPLSFSLCKGKEASGYTDSDCKDVEILCIETCLDDYWRGNQLSDW